MARVKTPKKAPAKTRVVRADAQRNLGSLLEAAKAVFATSGVEAPVREIAARAGIGLATVYRHFPQRSDLVAAVFRREVDACAAAAAELVNERDPLVALVKWLDRYTRFIATKRGLAAALHSGNPAFDCLPSYFREKLEPALQSLLASAADAGRIRANVDAYELLRAVGNLAVPDRDAAPGHSQRMVALLVDGLRYGATRPLDASTRAGRQSATPT